jgi:hypothetical protein
MLSPHAFAAIAAVADVAGSVVVVRAHRGRQALRYFVAGSAGFAIRIVSARDGAVR